MFGTRDHAIRPQAGSLEPAHLRSRHRGAEIGILAGAFLNAPPSGIVSDVEHRRECPTDSRAPSFPGREGLRLLLHGGIP